MWCFTIRGDKIISQPMQLTILVRLNNVAITINVPPATWLARHTAPLIQQPRKLTQITSRTTTPTTIVNKTRPPLMLRTLTRTRINPLSISATRKSSQQPSETNRPLRRRLITMLRTINPRPSTAATLLHPSNATRITAFHGNFRHGRPSAPYRS